MARKNLWTALFRGACSRCPNCGRGKLFRSYLKPVDACSECGEPLKHIRADDGPAWLTVLIVGHIVVGLALYQEMHAPLAVETSIAIYLSLALAMILTLLPRAKGIFIGLIWAMDATGVDLRQPKYLP
jgi:uncharacterized protein (DUF983 family)